MGDGAHVDQSATDAEAAVAQVVHRCPGGCDVLSQLGQEATAIAAQPARYRRGDGISEIALRLYLTVGFVGVVGLVVLGITSTDGWVHRLGGRAWRRLHKLVFAVAVLGLLHFMLHTKSDITEPVLTMGLFVWLMAYRAVAPEGGAPSTPRLLGVSIVSALVTGGAEAAWYALKTGVNATLVLKANLDWEFGLRPAGWVLVVGLGITALRELARLVTRGGRTRRVRAA